MKNILLLKNMLNSPFRTLLLVVALSVSAFTSRGADYYWVNGSGNWSDYANHWATTSGGTIFHTTIPTLNDNVFFDANSFTAGGQVVLIDNTLIYCNSMDFTGVTFNPSVNGLGNTLHVYGSLTLSPAMTWNVKRVDFKGANPGNTVSQAGHTLDTLYFNGAGSYQLTEPTVAKSIYIYDGTFASGGFAITVRKFVAGTTGATVNVDLGNSVVNVSDVFRAYDGTVNMNAASADLNFINSVVPKMYFWVSGQTFNDIFSQSNTEVIGNFNCQQLTAMGTFYINSNWTSSTCVDASFSGNTTLDCNFTAGTLVVNTPGSFLKMRVLNIGTAFTATGLCGQPILIQPIDFLGSGTLSMASGSVTVDYAIITAINATGGATFNATNSIDGGNNAGWNISSPAQRTLYWVGGSGSWSDISHWSLSSGGAGGNCIPASFDNVIFDGASFTQPGDTVWIDAAQANCFNMDWTGVTNNPVLTGPMLMDVSIYGSLTLDPNMTVGLYSFEFRGSATGNTIYPAGLPINSIFVDGTGSWALTGTLQCENVQVYRGTFSTGNHDVYASGFIANGIGNSIVVNLGTSTLYVGANYWAFDNNIVVNSAAANLVFNNTGGATIYAQLANAVFNNVTSLSYTYYSGNLTCINFDAQAGVHINNLVAQHAQFALASTGSQFFLDTLVLGNGVINFGFDSLVVGDVFNSFADCATPLTLRPYSPFNAQCHFVKTAGTVTLQYTYLDRVAASGGAAFVANNSWDLGSNSGWTINSATARDLYWVGGNGSWQDAAHWATTSGGAGGNCQPGPQDNAFFDANSFPAADTVFVHPTLGVFVNSLSFAGVPAGTVLYSSSSNYDIHVDGSLLMTPELNLYNVAINMTSSNPGNTITTGNNTISEFRLSGSGEWDLTDELTVFNFSAGNGIFRTNNFDVNASGINLGGSAVLELGTSTVSTLGIWLSNINVSIVGENADLVINSSVLSMKLLGEHFRSITFMGDAHTETGFSCDYLYALGDFIDIDSQTINAMYAEFKGEVTLPDYFVSDTLILDNPGNIVRFFDITVNDYMFANGNSGFPIQLEGINGAGTLHKSTGQICLDYVLIKDIAATGGAQFFAGTNGVDLGGNSGWIFGPCAPLVTDVWPGDADYDLTADNTDILYIGLAYGYTGPVRANASLNWLAQPAVDWSFQFANGTNLKHADTDGNGAVDFDDTLAVSLNYGLTHPPRLMPPSPGQLPSPLLYIETNPDTAALSDTVEVDIFLGTNLTPVDSIYGIAFTVNFDTALVNVNYLTADFSTCWMGNAQLDMIAFHKNLMTQGKVDIALARTDQQNINGFGLIGRLGIVIVDNVGAKVTLPVVLSDITALTASEYLLTILTENDSVVIDTAGTVGLPEWHGNHFSASLHPNPASDYLTVQTDPAVSMVAYEIYSATGARLANQPVQANRFVVETRNLDGGVYFIKLISSSGVTVKRIEVMKR